MVSNRIKGVINQTKTKAYFYGNYDCIFAFITDGAGDQTHIFISELKYTSDKPINGQLFEILLGFFSSWFYMTVIFMIMPFLMVSNKHAPADVMKRFNIFFILEIWI